jgi:UDP-glucose 4-epimerase
LNEPDIIFHLAASAHTRATSAGWDDPQFDNEVNAKGTINVFEAVRRLEIDPKIVYASSAAVYGGPENPPMTEDHPKKPISPYGVHKLAGENHMFAYCDQHGLDISAIRIFNTFGPRQPRYVMYDFFKKLQEDNSELEVLGTGRQIRDYCYIDDTVKAFEIVAEKGEKGEAYNLSGDNVISINDLAELMIDIADLDASYYNTDESWKGDPKRLEADISKLKELGFEPEVDIEEGLRRLKDWFEKTEGKIRN